MYLMRSSNEQNLLKVTFLQKGGWHVELGSDSMSVSLVQGCFDCESYVRHAAQ